MVPTPILNKLFRFHTWRPAVTATAMASGTPCGAVSTGVVFRQYTTSIPITAGVNTLPRYWITGGISFPFGNSRNGTRRVEKVAAATTNIIRNDFTALIGWNIYQGIGWQL